MTIANRSLWLKGSAILIFALCLLIGHRLSQLKILWNDEIYTQSYVIEQKSLRDISLSRFMEGNNCPLFYFIQKGICLAANYTFPRNAAGEWYLSDPKAQVILRLSSNVFMSASIAFIFYFFAFVYSGWAGGYALLVTLSSLMLWAYWAEARPYALWFFLTTVQLLLFLHILRKEKPGRQSFGWLAAVQVLLSLTTILSLPQIMAVSFLLWVAKDRNIKRHIWLTALPLGICIFYYFQSPVLIRYHLPRAPWQLIFANIPKESVLIAGIYGLFLGSYYRQHKKKASKQQERDAVLAGGNYLILTMLLLAASFMLLLVFQLRAMSNPSQFGISSRYFINLAPVGIIATVLFSVCLMRAFKGQTWMLINIAVVLAGLLVIRFLKTYTEIAGTGLY